MRLGNHHEAEQAAAFIGRHHTFTISGWTATRGGEHSASRTTGYSHGTSQSRSAASTSGWGGDGLWHESSSGGHTRSRDSGRSQEWSQSDATSDGASWSTAQNVQRVYEYAVEPAVLQNLPGTALLLPARGTAHRDLLAVECDPWIITLPGVAASLAVADHPATVRPAAGPGNRPGLASPRQQPAWQPRQGFPAENMPAWPPQRPAPRWPRPRG